MPLQWRHQAYSRLVERYAVFAVTTLRSLLMRPSAGFACYAPKQHQFYEEKMTELLRIVPGLKLPFSNSVFATATFNIGGNVWTLEHADTENFAAGWCGIAALGNYNHKTSGHLVLHLLKLVIEFPPKTQALIMSAAVSHSNIPIQPGEERWSITQYTAAGIFRFLAQDGKTRKVWAKEDPAAFAAYEATHSERWDEHIERFSTAEGLVDDIRTVYGLGQ